jgi:hypothetical protein
MGVFRPIHLLHAVWALRVLLAFLLVSGHAHADAPLTLAGTWSASPLIATWQIGDWGESCGPKPGGGGVPGGPVTISQNGSELTFVGAGRTFSTAECWEQHPGLSRISHSASARSFQNVCKTAAGDARQAKIVTTINATDSRINFDETGQYQFVIEGQNCTASVRRTRSYSLVLRQGHTAPSAPSAKAATKPAPRPARDCANAGLPERLEVRPSRKLMRPGESFSFRTTVLDARGCALPVTPNWSVLGGSTALSVTAPGSVAAAPGAPESEVTLEVTLGDRSVRVVVEIAAKDRYDALLQARGLDESGESKDAAVLRVASESLGAREVVARDDSKGKTRWFAAVVGALALLLGVTGILLVRRSRRATEAAAVASPSRPRAAPSAGTKVCPTCREEFPPHAEFCDKDGNRLVLQSALPIGPGGSVCPVCGRGFNPGTLTCPEHHEELIPVAAFAARAAATPPTQSICPMCGSQFTGDIRFCGECGAALVPIN